MFFFFLHFRCCTGDSFRPIFSKVKSGSVHIVHPLNFGTILQLSGVLHPCLLYCLKTEPFSGSAALSHPNYLQLMRKIQRTEAGILSDSTEIGHCIFCNPLTWVQSLTSQIVPCVPQKRFLIQNQPNKISKQQTN